MVSYSSAKPRADMDMGAAARRPPKEILVEQWVDEWAPPNHPQNQHPTTDMQALMEAAPHQNPETSQEEYDARPAPTIQALEQLDDPWRTVITWHVLEQRSLRDIAEELGLDHPYQVSRIRDTGFEMIETIMGTTQEDWTLGA